jgi:hypothetical protein
MDFVALLRFRSSVTSAERDAAMVRRAGWKYPDGLRMIAEYWPTGSAVQVVSIFSADDFTGVMELQLEWSDVFDIDIYPAVSAEDGLKVGSDLLGRLPRLQST